MRFRSLHTLCKAFNSLLVLAISFSVAHAQVTTDPIFPTVNDNVTITYNAAAGNGALKGIGPVFAHMGVITNLSTSPTDWKHVATTWGISDPVGAMSSVGTDLWQKTINIKTFFNIPANETVLKLAFVFRNANGTIVGRAADGSDIFYDVYPVNAPLQVKLLNPSQNLLLAQVGTQIAVKGAASKTATLRLYDNGTEITSAQGVQLDYTLNVSTAGLHLVQLVAQSGNESDTASFQYLLPENLPAQDPPAGTELGIHYIDNQTVRLSLYAPNKQVVYVLGDFTNWELKPAYQLRKSVDGNTWWIEITGLTPGQRYRFQYVVNGQMRIADPLSTLVLDPWNDPYIPAVTYPDMPVYPTGKTTGLVSVLQTAPPVYNWQATNYQRPKKTDLVIYELLVRDFVARHDFQTITDTLNYLQRLGVTALELMPVNEFDGNINWGYGPSFHKALDKYYGDATALKRLIDEAHKRNMAVILDVVFNHVTGASPLAQLYWDATNNRPAADNPWLNPVAKHEFNVFNDFNHESAATRAYVKNCLKYWLTEFRVDGYRFDLSKGFTQKNTLGSVSAWGIYDDSRIAILKDYANTMWSVDPAAYVILEHFADNNEEVELSNYGMMLWGNQWGAYKEVALGYSGGVNANLSGISYKQRGWTNPHLVGYMESHDEDRIGYELKTYGNSSTPGYDTKTLPVAMRRLELLTHLLYTVPGPKMLWQFGEVGYDFHINLCENGTVNQSCRTSPKPIRWDYYQNPYRRRLYDVTAALLHLRKDYDVFETTDFQISLASGNGRYVRLNSASLNVLALANVATTASMVTPNFQHTGTWYDYYTGDSIQVTNTTADLQFQAGEYRLYLDKYVKLPAGLNPTPTREINGLITGLEIYPNPASDRFYLDFSLEQEAYMSIEVMDWTGRLIVGFPAGHFPAGDQHLELNAASWPAGSYMLVIRTAEGRTAARRMVKN